LGGKLLRKITILEEESRCAPFRPALAAKFAFSRSTAPWPSSSALMPPKKPIPTRWGDEHKQAILKGFREHNWDPQETSGIKINRRIKDTPDALAILQPFFSINDGGTKTSNNQLYQHYKDLGCEFIVAKTRAGWRRESEGAFGRSIDRSASLFSLLMLLLLLLFLFFFQRPTPKTKD